MSCGEFRQSAPRGVVANRAFRAYPPTMCGRFASTTPPDTIARLFRTTGPVPNVAPSWNVAPGQNAMVVRRHPENGERRLDLLGWGLVPHWTKDLHSARKPINARAETVATMPMFRDAFRRRRCIVPADAFYEWQPRDDGPKQPFAAARANGGVLAFAGLWEGWRAPDGETLRTFAIVVSAANKDMAPIHDRMPVILEQPEWPLWLGDVEGDARALLHPPEVGTLKIWPVGTRVNRPANNDAGLLEPAG